jgi:glycerol-3-phosphate acyltransferase PlsX
MLPVAVDAMGGDRAPGEILAAARTASSSASRSCSSAPPASPASTAVPYLEANEVIGMDEDAAQGVRRKKDSTLVRAAEAVRDGRASADDLRRQHRRDDGLGAAADGPHQGRQPAGDRDADPGARALAEHPPRRRRERRGAARVARPVRADGRRLRASPVRSCGPQGRAAVDRRGAGKGDTLRKEAYDLLGAATGINFIGNVEGRDMLLKTADVIVTDGFTGNVVLKTLEGSLKMLMARSCRPRPGRSTRSTSMRCSRR